jgi:hypothetical protein
MPLRPAPPPGLALWSRFTDFAAKASGGTAMRYNGISGFLDQGKAALATGPVAIIMAEDAVEVDTTLRHHQAAGFREVILLAPDEIPLPEALEATIHRVTCDVHAEDAMVSAVNRISAAAPGVWFYYGFNAEYLFFPFCETRNIREMLAFQSEERRDAVLSYVVDLYAGDLGRAPLAVSLDDAHLDRSGYYALARRDPANHNHPRERQLDFFGGLRWRFEEHIPPNRRTIDRIALFRAKEGLVLRPGFTFSDEEYNTYACPWHNNITTAVCSFRIAKALRSNPGSKFDIHNFRWHNSTEFQWHSQQLMDLGLMEPGQWF